MRIPTATLAVLTICAPAWPQPGIKPEVDWTAIDRKLDALRVAVQSRDIDKSHELTQQLWQLASGEWVKQTPTPAERLAEAESNYSPGHTSSLPYLAMQAIRAEQFDKAQSYAYQTLRNPSDAYDSVHTGNIVLGLVALNRDHDTDMAKTYLRSSAKTKGSMLLSRWGPNLALAKALLDKGEKDVVLEYFQLCKNFVTKNPKLDGWIAMLNGGGTPDLASEYLWFQ